MVQDDAVASPLMVHMSKKTITVLLGILILDVATNASRGNAGNPLPSDIVSHPRRKETSTPLI
jgi:hypothetical protein